MNNYFEYREKAIFFNLYDRNLLLDSFEYLEKLIEVKEYERI